MATTIAQRELRNDSGNILRRVENGEEFIVTRNGTPVAELRPVVRRRAVSRRRLSEAFRGIPTIDLVTLRADLDAHSDPALHDPWRTRG
ncbi:MAG: type II toxin-antitoxin system Phd/YefM family antitoxin [Egibacteraceae bacterium]